MRDSKRQRQMAVSRKNRSGRDYMHLIIYCLTKIQQKKILLRRVWRRRRFLTRLAQPKNPVLMICLFVRLSL